MFLKNVLNTCENRVRLFRRPSSRSRTPRHMMSMLFPVAESKSESTPCASVSIATKAIALDIIEIVLMVFLKFAR